MTRTQFIDNVARLQKKHLRTPFPGISSFDFYLSRTNLCLYVHPVNDNRELLSVNVYSFDGPEAIDNQWAAVYGYLAKEEAAYEGRDAQ